MTEFEAKNSGRGNDAILTTPHALHCNSRADLANEKNSVLGRIMHSH